MQESRTPLKFNSTYGHPSLDKHPCLNHDQNLRQWLEERSRARRRIRRAISFAQLMLDVLCLGVLSLFVVLALIGALLL